jgi:hypothetical protein
MSQANVRNVDAIKDFKNALVTFGEEAHTALSGVEMEIRQTRNWLERDQISYWKGQVKKGQEAVAEARADLFRRKISQSNSESVSDAEQKEALRVATRRLQMAEEMVERCKKWVPVLEHAIAEYHSQSQPLGDHLSGKFTNSVALLDRMVIAVEHYLATEAPSMSMERPSAGSAASATSTRATPGSAASGGTPAEAPAPAETAAATAAATTAAEGGEAAPAAEERQEAAAGGS